MFQAHSNLKISMKTIVAGIAAASIVGLSACGGGGTTTPTPTPGGGGGAGATVSPYSLFASTYVRYAAQTNGAFVHSIQAGDIYSGAAGALAYGGYDSAQADINRTGFYNYQFVAGATAPITGADYAFISFLAPLNATFDISTATTLLIQMGNSGNPDTPNNAKVFTVDLNDTVPSTQVSKNDCAVDVTLRSVGQNIPKSALGVSTYAIPLSSFTCSKGTLAALQSGGITTVAVKVTGDKNKTMTAGELNLIGVGMIGFSSAVTAAVQTELDK